MCYWNKVNMMSVKQIMCVRTLRLLSHTRYNTLENFLLEYCSSYEGYLNLVFIYAI